ncbi:PREDICTED: uncharacterized protein LOC106809060 isoform X2 [Priapulus caudatus]|uniref:Uncharacterized protein LOC106809060 isoform X1 n=1 Tax=Priapulus caudatus TaxID=37621 RepID=A0ABM1E5L7_PRICU|nr:PREDICTED: uncharacterized protein LOC106809060 isoform X1 [Priapulus caudatus]XP_014667490.1 PREDICTED: uncharacterized protein LOC106809060 isoform X2 [Priapulus caudatus]
MNDQSCFMCWETCSMLYMDYQVWGMMCKIPELCYEGCQVSCRFHEEHVFETQHLPTSDVNKLAVQMEDSDTELLLRWEPEGVPIDRSVVYQLTWRENEHSDWMGIVQTREIEHRLQKINFPEKFQLQIMAVDSKGILSVTGSQYPADEQVLLLDISVAVATRDARLDATVTWKHKTDTTATGDIGYSIAWKRTSCNKDSAYPVCVAEEHQPKFLIVPSEKDVSA